ncbi:MAG: PilZ domain-containing protein [Polyangiaceae bacterium]|nr:PilZ domain-containing protein [Polyangiaceae bacterium]
MSVEKERRAGSPRVPFQTLVEIGAGEGSSAAFEAESVDVTTAGLHLRTAYLPEIGESLLCRLDAGGREVVVQGEVVWRNDDNYGGDFGVRFVDVEPDSMQALRELTGDVTLDEAPNATAKPEANTPSVARGTRVRLHIEGLGSPMKARVRDGSRSELMVGSNLEFLKVGRSVDLENVDAADSRPARIERVAIEVEPSTNVPQLVVALRYLDVADAPADEEQELSRVKYDTDGCDKPEDDSTDAARASACGELDDMGDGDEPLDDENGSPEEGEGKGAAVWRKVKETGPKFAVLGLAAKRLGLRAKDAVGDAVARAKKRANEPGGGRAGAAPGRPTAGGRTAEARSDLRSDCAAAHCGGRCVCEERVVCG